MRFTFALDPILKLREQAMESAVLRLGAAMRALTAAQAEARAAEEHLVRNAAFIQSPDPVVRWAAAQVHPLLWERQKRAAERLSAAQAEIAAARELLQRRTAERDALARMREAAYAQWRIETERKAQAEIDDAAARLAGKAPGEGRGERL